MLRENGSITESQFQEFTANGAIGSHPENLQPKGGFKGFNQRAVSIIIAETDARFAAGNQVIRGQQLGLTPRLSKR